MILPSKSVSNTYHVRPVTIPSNVTKPYSGFSISAEPSTVIDFTSL